jgi:hypothetical protein
MMPDTDDNRPAISTGNRFPDDLRQLAYEIWLLKADRNATRTQRLLAEECRLAADEQVDDNTGEITLVDDESLPIPTVRQVQRWAKDGDWEHKADDDVARLAPKLYKRFNTRLFTTIPLAQQWDFDFLAEMCMRPNLNAGMAGRTDAGQPAPSPRARPGGGSIPAGDGACPAGTDQGAAGRAVERTTHLLETPRAPSRGRSLYWDARYTNPGSPSHGFPRGVLGAG